MNAELSYSQVVEMLPAYTLGALEPAEMLAVDEYVQTSPELQTWLRELEEALGELAYAAPDMILPANSKQRLLSLARADLATQAEPDSRSSTPLAKPGLRPTPWLQPDQPAGRSMPLGGWLAGWRHRGLALGGALLALLLGWYMVQLQTQLNQVREQLKTIQDTVVALDQAVQNLQGGGQSQAIQTKIANLEQQVQDNQGVLEEIAAANPMMQAQLEQTVAQLETMQGTVQKLEQQLQDTQQVLAIVTNADLQVPLARTELLTTEIPVDVRATFYQSGDQGILVVEGLEPLPPAQIYQLWLVVNGQPTPVPDGLLQIAESDVPTSLIVAVPPAMQEFTIVDVSVEPAGGSQEITKEAVVLRGSVN